MRTDKVQPPYPNYTAFIKGEFRARHKTVDKDSEVLQIEHHGGEVRLYFSKENWEDLVKFFSE